MVRLPVLVGSVPLSPPDSPLKSFPWMRFVEDIVQGWKARSHTRLSGRKEGKGGERVGSEVEV